MKCEGMRRYGGAFTFGPPTWVPCKEKATVMLTLKQHGEPKQTLPACQVCWDEALHTPEISVLHAQPIVKEGTRRGTRKLVDSSSAGSGNRTRSVDRAHGPADARPEGRDTGGS